MMMMMIEETGEVRMTSLPEELMILKEGQARVPQSTGRHRAEQQQTADNNSRRLLCSVSPSRLTNCSCTRSTVRHPHYTDTATHRSSVSSALTTTTHQCHHSVVCVCVCLLPDTETQSRSTQLGANGPEVKRAIPG